MAAKLNSNCKVQIMKWFKVQGEKEFFLNYITNTNEINHFTPHPSLPLKGGGLGWG